jgi:nucleotide-binding universal stress UspA family protein
MTGSAGADFDAGVPPIVVGVSPSRGSPSALRWALAEAERRRAPLHTVMAWRPPRPPVAPAGRPPAGLVSSEEELQKQAMADLEGLVLDALDDTERVLLDVAKGGTVAVLQTASAKAQLLVVGAAHQTPVSGVGRDRRRAPAISERISCPVVLIPPHLREGLLPEAARPAGAAHR